MNRTAKDNALEFGRITQQGYGVHLGLLAACSVERQQGRRATSATFQKLTAAEFAKAAGVSARTVSNYLDKWDRMADAGWDVDRKDLTPSDVDTLQMSKQFVSEFDALNVRDGGEHTGLDGKAADIAKNKQAMKAAIMADPKVAEAAYDAVLESSHRGEGKVPRVNKPPTTKAGRDARAKLGAANKADDEITGPILEAGSLLLKAQKAWAESEGHLDASSRRMVKQTLTDILVAVESLRMEMGFAEAAR